MLCPACGQTNPDATNFCERCGNTLATAASAASAPTAGPQTSGKAVASLILGLLGIFVVWIVASVPAVVLGHMARADIQQSGGRLKGSGLATAGLVLGYLSLIVWPLVMFMAIFAYAR